MNILQWIDNLGRKVTGVEKPQRANNTEEYIPIDDIRVVAFAQALELGESIKWEVVHGYYTNYVLLQQQYKELTGEYYDLTT